MFLKILIDHVKSHSIKLKILRFERYSLFKSSGKLSGELKMGIFNQFSDTMLIEETILWPIRVDLLRSICKIN